MLKINLIFKNLQTHGQITREFLRLRMRNFRGTVFICTQAYKEIFKSALCTFNFAIVVCCSRLRH